MSRRKSLSGARWKPDTQNFDRDLAYRHDCGQLDELEMAIYATIKERSKKWPRAEIVEVWAEAYQMTQADIAGNRDWGTLTKEEKFEFACERAKTNTNKAMRIDDGLRVGMWQMKGDEAHIALKIGGAHYALDKERDSQGQYAGRFKDKPPEITEYEEGSEFDDTEDDAEDDTDVTDDEVEVEVDEVEEISCRSYEDTAEIDRVEQDNADYQDGSARIALENAPAGSSTLLPTETGNEDIPPGLSPDSSADDDDKRSLIGDFLENQGGHITYRADWTKVHAEQNKVLDRLHIEQQIEKYPDGVEAKAAKAEEESETEYETLVRILGPKQADWLWGYEWDIAGSNQRTRPASSAKDRSRAYRLRQKVIIAAAAAARPTVPPEVFVTTCALYERDTRPT
jgi:hypothetical protein